jgi:hypothetical protein
MDLKYRFQHRDRQSGQNIFRNPSNNMPPVADRSSQPQNSKSGLNKYKKKTVAGKAPEGQYKKYMLEANNIFFENRPELKKIEDLKAARWFLITLWVVLALTYFLVGRLTPFEGICPAHARCGVFVHCAEFYEYDGDANTCVLSQKIVTEIQELA